MVSMTVPDPDDVDSQLVAAVTDAADSYAEVTIIPSEQDSRPGIVKVKKGNIYLSEIEDFDATGVGQMVDKTYIHFG